MSAEPRKYEVTIVRHIREDTPMTDYVTVTAYSAMDAKDQVLIADTSVAVREVKPAPCEYDHTTRCVTHDSFHREWP